MLRCLPTVVALGQFQIGAIMCRGYKRPSDSLADRRSSGSAQRRQRNRLQDTESSGRPAAFGHQAKAPVCEKSTTSKWLMFAISNHFNQLAKLL